MAFELMFVDRWRPVKVNKSPIPCYLHKYLIFTLNRQENQKILLHDINEGHSYDLRDSFLVFVFMYGNGLLFLTL